MAVAVSTRFSTAEDHRRCAAGIFTHTQDGLSLSLAKGPSLRSGASCLLDAAPARRQGDAPRDNRFEGAGRGHQGQRRQADPAPASAMASAFAKLQTRKG